MPLLTVFTPSYNRRHTLGRAFDSLCRQSCKNFQWLIIDDGSTDQTDELVAEWQQENHGFPICYCYQSNGGLHTGYNKAIELTDTELMVCLDSDDYFPDNTVELIQKTWLSRRNENLGGIIGLDCTPDGEPIGNTLPSTETLNLIDVCIGKIDVHGDKKQVVRTDLYKKVAPMPSFPGEKNFNPYYMILQIAMDYEFLVLNENLCFVDYQDDGMTANQWKQYYNSPNSFAETRKLYLSLPGASLGYQLKQAIHYVSSCILAGRRHFISDSPRKIVTVLALPAGIILTWYIRYKAKM